MGRDYSQFELIIIITFSFIFLLAIAVLGGNSIAKTQTADQRLTDAKEVNVTILDLKKEISTTQDQDLHIEVRIQFEYTYNGKHYRSDLLYPMDSLRVFNNRQKANRFIDNHDEGETVTAYLDPAHPGEAFLIHRKKHTMNFNLLLMVALGVPNLVALGYYSRKLLKRRQ